VSCAFSGLAPLKPKLMSKALSFNLFEYPETTECKFGVELVCAGGCDVNEED
jgi:hypothetical protein